MEIKILKGDITKIRADAIVNAAGTSLVMGGGVAGAIRRAGGQEIQEEALKKAPIKIGEAIETNAGKLNAKYVIHAAAMPHYGTGKASAESIKEATLNSLKLADRLNCETIAIPAIGCGIAGFPIKEGAKVILKEIKGYKSKNLRLAYIVLYSYYDYEIFKGIEKDLNP